MPIYRKDQWRIYRLHVEEKFRKPEQPEREMCLYFDQKGQNGTADLADCMIQTLPATEEEFMERRSKHSL